MSYTLGEAARATGKSKATIHRYVQSGKVSATKDEATGAWIIDPAELHRVCPPVSAGHAQNGASGHSETAAETLLKVQLEQEREERQRERVQLEGTIDDLRRRLDTEGEERRRLTAILTDQRAKQPPLPEVIAMPSPSQASQVAPAPARNGDARQQPPAHASPPPAVVKVRPARKANGATAKEVSWLRRMMGGR